MAITLEANYSKKLGLPGYSSHQYSITIRTELTDAKMVESESSRLYALLQGCVDKDIQQTGFLPGNGHSNGSSANGNGHSNGSQPSGNGSSGNGNQASNPPSNGTPSNGRSNGQSEAWACSDKQRSLILKIIDEHRLEKRDIELLAMERFGKGVKALNRMEASGLIEELLEIHGTKGNGGGNRLQKGRPA